MTRNKIGSVVLLTHAIICLVIYSIMMIVGLAEEWIDFTSVYFIIKVAIGIALTVFSARCMKMETDIKYGQMLHYCILISFASWIVLFIPIAVGLFITDWTWNVTQGLFIFGIFVVFAIYQTWRKRNLNRLRLDVMSDIRFRKFNDEEA